MANTTKLSFSEIYPVLDEMCKYIDHRLWKAKRGKKEHKVYEGYGSFKEFLIDIESDAIKFVAEKLKLTSTTVKERWKILTMPMPVYSALESEELNISKLKSLALTNWDFEDPQDVAITQEIVDAIKKDISASELRTLIKEKCKDMWRSSTVVMEHLAQQNGINAKTIC